jgi:hypothetical protein
MVISLLNVQHQIILLFLNKIVHEILINKSLNMAALLAVQNMADYCVIFQKVYITTVPKTNIST